MSTTDPDAAKRLASRESRPIVLPSVEDASRRIREAWAEKIGNSTDIAAQAVLDLIASRVPVWVPIEPGTVVKAGTRVREDWDDQITEWILGQDEDLYTSRSRSPRYWLDPRTVPAEPEDPRVAVVVGYFLTSDENARDLLARLDALEADR